VLSQMLSVLCMCGHVQATTPLDPRVLDAMLPFMTDQFGNPHSRTHLYGWESEEAVEKARAQV
jgi:cysteine desulfurase